MCHMVCLLFDAAYFCVSLVFGYFEIEKACLLGRIVAARTKADVRHLLKATSNCHRDLPNCLIVSRLQITDLKKAIAEICNF